MNQSSPSMPVNLVVVRHGESLGNVAKRMSEQGDNSLISMLSASHTAKWPLSKKGRKQAKDTGEFINKLITSSELNFDRMYVSAFSRALGTAGLLGLSQENWIVDSRLTERDWGSFDRMSEEEREVNFKEDLAIRNTEPFFWAPPNGESFNQLVIRLRDFVDSLARSNAHDVLVVCHGEVMKALRIIFLQLTPSEYAEMEFSEDSLDRIHNCQIDWYTRNQSRIDTQEPSKRFEKLSVYRPSSGNHSLVTSFPVARKRYTNNDLLAMAGELSLPFANIDI